MDRNIWIIAADDVSAGSITGIAKKLGGHLTAVVAGPKERAEAAAAFGPDSLIWYPTDEKTPAEAWSQAVAEAAFQAAPQVVLCANAPSARVMLGAIAAKLQMAVSTCVTDIGIDGDKLIIKRMLADDKAVETIETQKPFAGIAAEGLEEAQTADKADIVQTDQTPSDRLTTLDIMLETGGADLANADRVVSAGAGIGSKDNVALIEKLAQAFHAEVACSLPACDNYRWFDHTHVVGSSTQKISPQIYLMVGISGQPQHMTGVRGAKNIIAINNDPEAPIFSKCDYGIVGDLNKIVPVLTEAFLQLSN